MVTKFPFPNFYEPARFNMLYDERFPTVALEAAAMQRQHNVMPARSDRQGKRIAVFLIDFQRTFAAPNLIPGPGNFDFQLGVPGALQDAQRFCEWFMSNANRIGRKYITLDTHSGAQIFHSMFWQDGSGNHPPPFTIMEKKGGSIVGSDGKQYFAKYHPALAEKYLEMLAGGGKYSLMIWPYHSMNGSLGHALITPLHEVLFWHDLLRQEQTYQQTKGTWVLTEAYSGISDEIREVTVNGQKHVIGQVYSQLLKAVDDNDQVVFAGEASSHCVKATIEDMANLTAQKDPELLKKFFILKDCMSPVPQTPGGPDFPAIAQQALSKFKSMGMNIVTTQDDFLL